MVQNSNSKLQESLSALMDNEASELELHRLLKAVETDDALRASWTNYHMSGNSIRGDSIARVPVDLSAQISAAIADEPTHRVHERSSLASLWQAAGKLAVAASVAGAVVIGAQQYLQTEQAVLVAAPETVGGAAGVVPDGFAAPALNARTVNISDGPVLNMQPERASVVYQPTVQEQQIQNRVIEEHLNQLMLEHAENATKNSAQGLLPYARIAPDVTPESPKGAQPKLEQDSER